MPCHPRGHVALPHLVCLSHPDLALVCNLWEGLWQRGDSSSKSCDPGRAPGQRRRGLPWLVWEENGQLSVEHGEGPPNSGPEARFPPGPRAPALSSQAEQTEVSVGTLEDVAEGLVWPLQRSGGESLRPSHCCPGHDTGQEMLPLRWYLGPSDAQCFHSRGSDQFSCFYLVLRLSMMKGSLYLWLMNNQKLAVSAFI